MVDLIDRDALKDYIKNLWDMQDAYLPCHFFDAMDDMPTVDAEPVRHGHWKPSENHPPYYTCSECENCYIDKEWAKDGKWIYCPSCGAKMDEVVTK